MINKEVELAEKRDDTKRYFSFNIMYAEKEATLITLLFAFFLRGDLSRTIKARKGYAFPNNSVRHGHWLRKKTLKVRIVPN